MTESARPQDQHSYLPGVANPLCPSLRAKNRDRYVLPIANILLFPGSTAPIRGTLWRQYLKEEIAKTKLDPTHTIEIGMLPEPEPVVNPRRRQSWARRGYGPDRLRRLSERLMRALEELPEDDEVETPPSTPQEPPEIRHMRRELTNRIGTVAVVTSYNEHEEDLSVTTIGVRRFRVVESAPGDCIMDHAGHVVHGVRKLYVEDIAEGIPRPPRCDFSMKWYDPSSDHNHRRYMKALAIVSSTPYLALRSSWPWALMAKIRAKVKENETFAHVLESLANDPFLFSFQIANNLPFTEREKRAILEMHTIERLQAVLDKVSEQARQVIQCQSCQMTLCKTSDMFLVYGGTTAAYVNEYGFVHHTVTVSNIDEDEVVYTGPSETRDSWFPGYAWTIMSCSLCGSHLGWRFDRCGVDQTPPRFWGLSSANITTSYV